MFYGNGMTANDLKNPCSQSNLPGFWRRTCSGGGWGCNVEENRRDIAEQEKAIKRLCKLRDAAKAMEKAVGYKMGEMCKRGVVNDIR